MPLRTRRADAIPTPPRAGGFERTRWFAVWALFLAGCTLALHIGKAPPALPLLRIEMGLSLTEAGVIVSTYAILIAFTGVAFGLLASGVGHVRFAVAGVALAGVGSLLGTTVETLPPLLLSRAIEGLGWIVAVVALPSLVGALASPADRPLAMGLWGAFVPVGAGAMLLVAPLLQGAGGWRSSWLVAAALSLAASGVVALVCRREHACLAPLRRDVSRRRETVANDDGGGEADRGAIEQGEGEAFREPRGTRLRAALDDLRRPAAWLVGASFLCYSFQFGAVVSFLPTLLVETAGFALGAASALTASFILANAIGNVAAGWLLRRGVGHVPLLVGAALFAGAAAAVAYQPSWPVVPRLAAAFAFLLVSGAIPGTLFATVPRIASSPATLGALIGLMLQGSGAGQWLGPLALAGAVEAFGSWSAAALPILVAAVLGAFAASRLRDL